MDSRFEINLPMLYHALEFYASRGYKMITVPMCVDWEAIEVTMPSDRFAKRHGKDKFYVGSAEQSFIQLIQEYEKNGRPMSQHGSFMALTPCQRNEEVVDDSHFEIFLKLELISFDRNPQFDAWDFFNKYRPSGDKMEIVQEKDTEVDIQLNGIEIGSYGQRTINGLTINYGTGLAMPRISYALSKGVHSLA